jgi:hypothetical protein
MRLPQFLCLLLLNLQDLLQHILQAFDVRHNDGWDRRSTSAGGRSGILFEADMSPGDQTRSGYATSSRRRSE